MALLRSLVQPLNLAALLTWGAVALSMRTPDAGPQWATWVLMAVFIVAMLCNAATRMPGVRARIGLLVAAAGCALALCVLQARSGAAPVLLVIVSAHVAMQFGLRWAFAALAVIDVCLYLALRGGGHGSPLLTTVIYAGFQGFAMLVGHYARSAERTRDALALVNADLLATRALLADSARDAERLRVARELHDVAGHKLTALTLNLRALSEDPALSGRDELRTSRTLVAELLADIRGVVQALRDGRSLDLATALHALAAPLPRPRLQLELDPALRIDDLALADTVLRVVQEALTNAARHADADVLRVSIARDADGLSLTVEDDGRLCGTLREGNGLSGMRERIAAVGGSLSLVRAAHGGLRIDALLPL